jgi:capsular polysaccharide biosynthesis protein
MTIAAFVFGATAAAITLRLPGAYEANATLLVGRAATGSDPEYQDLLASQLLAQTYAEIAFTRPILSAVSTALNLGETPQQLAESMNVQASGANPIVRITVRGPSPERVAAIANEVARQLIAWKPSETPTDVQALPGLTQTLAALDAQIARAQAETGPLASPVTGASADALRGALSRLATLLSTRATLLQLIANTSTNSVRVIEPAEPPSEPARSGLVLNVVAAALLGALLAAGAVFAAREIRGSSGQPSTRA